LRVECYEDRHDRLLAELALFDLDVVLTDAPVTQDSSFRAHNHLLGESRVSLFAKPKLAERLRKDFPASLAGEAWLLPAEPTSLRRSLARWLEKRGLTPRVRGEFQDSALLAALGQAGEGIFAAPSIIEEEVVKEHRVARIAELEGVRERYFAITTERRIQNPAVRALMEGARTELFSAKG
jgi:LysR family transcriptional activator of nhaA